MKTSFRHLLAVLLLLLALPAPALAELSDGDGVIVGVPDLSAYVDGAGAAGRCALWADANTLTSDSGCTFNGTTDTLTLAGNVAAGGSSFSDARLVLWDNGAGLTAGLGIQSADFKLYLPSASDAFTFRPGPAGTPFATLTGAGRLSLGHSAAPSTSTVLDLGASFANNKVALYSSGGAIAGIGVQSGDLRFHLTSGSDKFSFRPSDSGASVAEISGAGIVESFAANNVAGFRLGVDGAKVCLEPTGTYCFRHTPASTEVSLNGAFLTSLTSVSGSQDSYFRSYNRLVSLHGSGTLSLTNDLAANSATANVTIDTGAVNRDADKPILAVNDNGSLVFAVDSDGDATATGNVVATGGLIVGTSGTEITASFRATTTDPNPGGDQVAANACEDTTAITVTGAAANAECIVSAPVGGPGSVSVTCYVSAADNVKLHICNPTGGAVTPATGTYSVRVFNP